MQPQITELQRQGVVGGQFMRGSGPLHENFDLPVRDNPALAGYGIAITGRARKNPFREARVNATAQLLRDTLDGSVDPFFWRQACQPSDEFAVQRLYEMYPALFAQVTRGGKYSLREMALREVMSVSDYQALYVDVLDRIYYGYYNAWPIVNMPIVRQHDLRDFRLVSRYLLDGLVTPFTATDAAAPAAEQSLSGPVPQDGSTFPTTNTAPIQYQPTLYQARASVNWRAMVNDDLGIFRDIAQRLAIVANRGISEFITKLFFQSTGLNTNLYKAGYNNLITTANGASINNPPLNAQGLQDAFKVLALMQDSSGNPILMSGKPWLVYGPSYHATVLNLVNGVKSMIQTEGGVGNAQGFPAQFVETTNWMMQNMGLVEDPYMPIVMSGAAGNIKSTAWAIVMDPGAQNRPAVEVGFLNGFKTPQMFRRMPNTMRIGGGVDETMGNFDSMDNDTKIVSVFGGTQIDGRSTVGSTGAGS